MELGLEAHLLSLRHLEASPAFLTTPSHDQGYLLQFSTPQRYPAVHSSGFCSLAENSLHLRNGSPQRPVNVSRRDSNNSTLSEQSEPRRALSMSLPGQLSSQLRTKSSILSYVIRPGRDQLDMSRRKRQAPCARLLMAGNLCASVVNFIC